MRTYAHSYEVDMNANTTWQYGLAKERGSVGGMQAFLYPIPRLLLVRKHHVVASLLFLELDYLSEFGGFSLLIAARSTLNSSFDTHSLQAYMHAKKPAKRGRSPKRPLHKFITTNQSCQTPPIAL